MTRRGWLWAATGFLVAAALGFYLLMHIGASGVTDDGKRPLTCAIDAEGGAPYIFQDPKNPGTYLGFEADIARALAEQLHRPIELKQYEYSSIFAGLARGDFDLSISGLEITPDRLEKFRFSRPYYIYRLQLVSRANEKRFQNLTDCAGRKDITIGTLEDTAAERLLDKMGIKK